MNEQIAMIELQSVTKLYGTVIGVNDFTLSLSAGAYGLLGPNGAGKSTLINLIMGQLQPTLGEVRVFGSSPVNNAAFFRRVGYCPSSEGMYAQVSGFAWVKYLQEVRGFDASQAAALAEAAMERVGIKDAMHRDIACYSRGMRQRTKLAQAIAHSPDLLVLDEPFNGLDPVARHEMTGMLHDWIGAGKSLVFASHLLHEVEMVTKSFLLICGGRLLASGTADEVQEMLAGLPSELIIRCNRPHELGVYVIEEQLADRVDISGEQLRLSTRQPGTLVQQLSKWLPRSGASVYELRSSDDSLQSLFNTLLRFHRGEL